MSDAVVDAHNPARTLADLRWRGQGLDAAIARLEARPDMLTPERVERLRALVGDGKAI